MKNGKLFFRAQNVALKLIVVVWAVLAVLYTSSLPNLLLVFLFMLMYLLFDPSIYLFWLKTVLKLIPFFIAYFFMGILFGLSFIHQLIISMKIVVLLLFSVYLICTTPKEFLSISTTDNKKLKDFQFYLVALLRFIPMLIERFKNLRAKNHNHIANLTEAVNQTAGDIESIKISNDLSKDNHLFRRFAILPNIYLVIFAAFITFILMWRDIGATIFHAIGL